MTEADDIFSDAEFKVGSAEVQDGDTEYGANDIESEMRNTETIRNPLKRKAETGTQGSEGLCRNFD